MTGQAATTDAFGPPGVATGRTHRACRRDLCRTLVDLGAVCLALALLVDALLVQGLLQPVIVASRSMAPGLLGPHRAWTCRACRRDFRCALDSAGAADQPSACPNCGARPFAADGRRYRGARVLVDRATFAWRAPRRWERVVFRDPRAPAELCVKRVVGLPGETVAIRDGDVLVDGQLAERSPDAAEQMSVCVYDTPSGDRRWTADAPHWRPAQGRALFVHQSTEDHVHWLRYDHQQTFRTGGPAPGPIVDDSPTDPGESRVPSTVKDLALDCEVLAAPGAELSLCIEVAGEGFAAVVDMASGGCRIARNGRLVAQGFAPHALTGAPCRWVLSLVDGHARLLLDGQVAVEARRQWTGGDTPGQSIALGARGAGVEVRGLRIWRDVHYQPPPAGWGGPIRLASDEYFVLGDNSPHAIDSRWPHMGPLGDVLLVGRPIAR